MTQHDQLHRYLFENASARGELVQLHNSYQAILGDHHYPAAVATLLGELLAATSLLTATLKFKGEIAVQLQGDGPVRLAVINGDHNQVMRGVARYEGEPQGSLQQLIGKGHMVITITPEEGERYQGVVALEGETLASCIEHYFLNSEQLNTRLWLFAHPGSQARAAGMLLQALPDETEHAETEFEHLEKLTQTIKAEELFELPAQEVLIRLYHQESVQLFDPQPVSYACGCSRERSAKALKSISKQELLEVCEGRGQLDLTCEYCGSVYSFDRMAIEELFAPADTVTRHGPH